MKDFPLVSIVVPCYNHEKYLVQALESVLEQNYPNKELIIIDDGSKDQSPTILKEWIKQNEDKIRIKLKIRPNKGLTKTLNESLTMVEGDYITFLASDDAMTPESITRRVDFLKNHPKKLVVIGDARGMDSHGNIVFESAIEDFYGGDKKNYISDERLKYSILNEWSVPGPVLLVNKKIFDIIGPYPEDILAEDLNFYLQVIGRDLLIFLDEIVALYRVHDYNMCRVPANSAKIGMSILKSYYRNRHLYSGKYRPMINRQIKLALRSQIVQKIKKVIGRKV